MGREEVIWCHSQLVERGRPLEPGAHPFAGPSDHPALEANVL